MFIIFPTTLYCLIRVVVEYDAPDVEDKYSEDIHSTCVHQLEGEDIYEECEDMADQMFNAWKEKLLEAYPIPPDA